MITTIIRNATSTLTLTAYDKNGKMKVDAEECPVLYKKSGLDKKNDGFFRLSHMCTFKKGNKTISYRAFLKIMESKTHKSDVKSLKK